jgi:hypothetical protein
MVERAAEISSTAPAPFMTIMLCFIVIVLNIPERK